MDFIGNSLFGFVGKNVHCHQSLDENMNKLKRKCEELNSRKEDVESKMKAELQPGKKVKKEVELWLANVERINDEKQSIENEVGEGKYFKRASLGKLVEEKIQEVEEHHRKGSFADGLVVDAPPRNGIILPTTKLAGETIVRKMEKIWACLINDDVGKIGVYGMGGSGKTTSMRHINNRILEETDKFGGVIWVTVSKALNVINLQNDIASQVNADISKYKDETIRAAKLFDILKEKKRHVLILDDMWEAFDLEAVGIPNPTLDNGWKIVLTTRSLDVCRRMNCTYFKMELLSEREAWNLFLDNVGRDVLCTPSLEEIAKLVANECSCLPLAIITIAGSMKGIADECEWRNALEELKESTKGLNTMRKVLEQLKYSYNRLEDEMHRHCLLYCALYPEDYGIERNELVEYLIVEGIIGARTRQAELDKGHSILNKLENTCLLESYTSNENKRCVKMHDLIRDMALQIMGYKCMVEAGVRLRDLPDEELWTEDLERVSLMNNNIRNIPSGASLRCSRLLTLLLRRNTRLRRIPDSFFVHMNGLKVLDLSYTGIETLPNSISDLENLTTLLLFCCRMLKNVPSLAKLTALRTLDLNRTGIIKVPRGMEMLVNLRCLYLNARFLKKFPAGILPKLSRLQHLVVWWGSEALKVKGEEVAGLRKLETFAGQFYDMGDFNRYAKSSHSQGPNNYLLQVGPGNRGINEVQCCVRKYVGVRKCNISSGEYSLLLPNDIEQLEIEECHDVSSLFNVSSSPSYCTPLQSLRVLKLSGLRNLRVLFKGEGTSPPSPLRLGTFSCLKELCISNCPNIKNLFTPELLPHLQNLESISVRACDGMEEIIAAKAEGEEEGTSESSNHSIVNNYDTITLPRLRFLFLRDLPELKAIVCSRAVMVCDSLQQIFSLPILNGQPSRPHSLEHIHVEDRKWWESLEWDHPTTKDVFQFYMPGHRYRNQ